MGNKILFLVFYFVCKVNSMALKGPILTRYDPCGLGLIHFDRISENYWSGEIQFGHYTNIVAAEVVMGFKEDTTISAVSFFLLVVVC